MDRAIGRSPGRRWKIDYRTTATAGGRPLAHPPGTTPDRPRSDMDLDLRRHVVYGVAYSDIELDVTCGICKADVGQPCRKVRGGSHTARLDKAGDRALRATTKLASAQERADPHGPLWSRAWAGHTCLVLGAHVAADCPVHR